MESTAATTWLAIIAIASLLQAMVIVGAAVVAYRLTRQLNERITRIERETFDPLMRKISSIADGAEDVVARVQSADDNVRALISRGAAQLNQTRRTIGEQMWPALGLTRGIVAAVSSVVTRQDRTMWRESRAVTPARSVEGVPHART